MLRDLLQISRPRFWHYLLGPWLLAWIAAGKNFDFQSLLWFLWLTLPANLLIYGLNDISDIEADQQNTKKQKYEKSLQKSKTSLLLVAIFISNCLILLVKHNYSSFWTLVSFLLVGAFYSLKPIRFKEMPLVDSISNILYVLPAFSYYFAISNQPIPQEVIIGATAWCAGMHLYSAIVDFEADKKAKLSTTVTILGKNMAYLLCFIYYSVAALGATIFNPNLLLLFLIYPVLIAYAYQNQESEMNIYKKFPLINLVVGFLLFMIYYWI